MATLTIRKLDDAVYDRLKAQANANKRSLEAEARHVLEQRTPDPKRAVARLRAMHEDHVAKYGYSHVNAVDLIRAVRDEE